MLQIPPAPYLCREQLREAQVRGSVRIERNTRRLGLFGVPNDDDGNRCPASDGLRNASQEDTGNAVAAVAPENDLIEAILCRVVEDGPCGIPCLPDGVYRRVVGVRPIRRVVEQRFGLDPCPFVSVVESTTGSDVVARIGGVEHVGDGDLGLGEVHERILKGCRREP